MRLSRWTVAVALVLATVVALGAQVAPRATNVRLLLRGEHGERIQPSKVSLLFDWWGGNEVVDLASPAGVTSIDLDSAWVAAKWPIIWSQMEGARVLITADGYAPMLSDTFAWLDQKQNGVEPVVTETTIAFNGQEALVRPGTQQDFTVTMRRPVTRRLRFIDQHGRPAAGLGVAVYMFWTQQNHCGHFEGEPIAQAKADAQGRITVPDGDFFYGLSIGRAVFEGEPVFFQRVVALTGLETTVTVRSFEQRTITLNVVDGGQPVAPVRVIGYDRYQGCMDSGLRPFGTTDATGRAVIQHFEAERYDAIIVCRAKQEVWSGTVDAFTKTAGRLDLAAAFTPVSMPFSACELANPQSPNPQSPIH